LSGKLLRTIQKVVWHCKN